MALDVIAEIGPKEYDRQIRSYQSKQRKTLSSKELQKKSLDEILGAEDEPIDGGLDTLYQLSDCINALPNGTVVDFDGLLWAKMLQYLQVFDPIQVRYAGTEWRTIVVKVLQTALAEQLPHMAILPIRNALLRLDPSGSTFTSLHLPFIRLCLDAGLYREALPILDNIISSFPSDYSHNLDGSYPCSPHRDSSGYITVISGLTESVDHRQVQEYYLLGGMIYIAQGRRRWEDAMLYLEMVLTAPTHNTPTGLMLEAYRKWLLLGVLLNGKTPDFPKTANNQAARSIQTVAKPYAALAAAFDQADIKNLKAEIDVGLKLWDEDGNLGLVLQLLPAYQRNYIFRLQELYASYPLPKLDKALGRGLDMVSSLISAGDLNAEIDSSGVEPVVRFLHNQESGPLAQIEQQLQQVLAAQLVRIKQLIEQVDLADKKVMMSPEYMYAARKAKAEAISADLRGERGEPSQSQLIYETQQSEMSMDLSGDPSMYVGDEDLME